MGSGVWSKDWFAGICFSAVFAVLTYAVLADSFESLERYAYDLGVQARSEVPSDRVAVIAIDDQSIENLGRWPWPRNLHAAMIDQLKAGGAKAIGNTIFYFEEQADPGLIYINELTEMLTSSSLAGQIPTEVLTFSAMLEDLSRQTSRAAPINQAWQQSALVTQYSSDVEQMATLLLEAQASLSVDNVLAQSMADAGNVNVAMAFALGRPQGRPDQQLPDYVQRYALTRVEDRIGAGSQGITPIETTAAAFPIPVIGSTAQGIGHLNSLPDVDGATRYEPLVLQHYNQYYPSMSLMLAAAALNLGPEDIQVNLGEGVTLGNVQIRTTGDLRMYTHYYGEQNGRAPFDVDSFFDVFTGKIPVSKYKDKIVLIGASAVGIGDNFATPVSPTMSPAESMAHVVSSLLKEHFYSRPFWATWAQLAAFILAALYLAFLLPRLGPGLAALLTLVFAGGMVFTQVGMMAVQAQWISLVIPALLLVTGHLFMTVKRLRLTERLKVSSEAQGAESNKMLGLAFQGQGQLDMAFEKFRSVKPVDDKLLDLIYNLALDYERKRQFNKAEAVYEYIAKHNPQFKDIDSKVNRAKKMSETVILGGGGGGSSASGTMIMDSGSVEKPMLGRYEVQKELGKGAMGVVYLGKDPKIGREVAIKTMALSQEFEEDELDDVKRRFFREAETAGRLSHPNIVSIFDCGEEHDLAYIAMEFIKGYDLTKHIKPDTLWPHKDVLKVIADSAEALDYAHGHGIVHRDIKPANLMWLVDRKMVKVTDFGIARLADSSKTKTGMVLGTPSYMSPEQLAGKKVDGRSDLFSLGVTLYQMLTGSLPFTADSMATLMYKIANEQQGHARAINPELPEGIDEIIDKAMAKDLEQRYASGAEFAQDLRKLLATMG